ncbi:hypothetical protein [Arthrobacter sp. zg-Y769]|uniref:hypothetical protein n=1 Tax=Arthrobacter sp. zg-Y769 TaxID=2894191 RepID=UPI001E4843B2|nr:hypothetical protein [Arthrobacter sp. zg-Y769]MCC9205796.1 hypothetical protein [Arthrobacter sp. zg-Y769]
MQLHWLGTSGRTGTITVRVPADQVAALQAAADDQAPAGKVSVIVEESEGMATPLSTNQGQAPQNRRWSRLRA